MKFDRERRKKANKPTKQSSGNSLPILHHGPTGRYETLHFIQRFKELITLFARRGLLLFTGFALADCDLAQWQPPWELVRIL
jgi:hypothetical protein